MGEGETNKLPNVVPAGSLVSRLSSTSAPIERNIFYSQPCTRRALPPPVPPQRYRDRSITQKCNVFETSPRMEARKSNEEAERRKSSSSIHLSFRTLSRKESYARSLSNEKRKSSRSLGSIEHQLAKDFKDFSSAPSLSRSPNSSGKSSMAGLKSTKESSNSRSSSKIENTQVIKAVANTSAEFNSPEYTKKSICSEKHLIDNDKVKERDFKLQEETLQQFHERGHSKPIFIKQLSKSASVETKKLRQKLDESPLQHGRKDSQIGVANAFKSATSSTSVKLVSIHNSEDTNEPMNKKNEKFPIANRENIETLNVHEKNKLALKASSEMLKRVEGRLFTKITDSQHESEDSNINTVSSTVPSLAANENYAHTSVYTKSKKAQKKLEEKNSSSKEPFSSEISLPKKLLSTKNLHSFSKVSKTSSIAKSVRKNQESRKKFDTTKTTPMNLGSTDTPVHASDTSYLSKDCRSASASPTGKKSLAVKVAELPFGDNIQEDAFFRGESSFDSSTKSAPLNFDNVSSKEMKQNLSSVAEDKVTSIQTPPGASNTSSGHSSASTSSTSNSKSGKLARLLRGSLKGIVALQSKNLADCGKDDNVKSQRSTSVSPQQEVYRNSSRSSLSQRSSRSSSLSSISSSRSSIFDVVRTLMRSKKQKRSASTSSNSSDGVAKSSNSNLAESEKVRHDLSVPQDPHDFLKQRQYPATVLQTQIFKLVKTKKGETKNKIWSRNLEQMNYASYAMKFPKCTSINTSLLIECLSRVLTVHQVVLSEFGSIPSTAVASRPGSGSNLQSLELQIATSPQNFDSKKYIRLLSRGISFEDAATFVLGEIMSSSVDAETIMGIMCYLHVLGDEIRLHIAASKAVCDTISCDIIGLSLFDLFKKCGTHVLQTAAVAEETELDAADGDLTSKCKSLFPLFLPAKRLDFLDYASHIATYRTPEKQKPAQVFFQAQVYDTRQEFVTHEMRMKIKQMITQMTSQQTELERQIRQITKKIAGFEINFSTVESARKRFAGSGKAPSENYFSIDNKQPRSRIMLPTEVLEIPEELVGLLEPAALGEGVKFTNVLREHDIPERFISKLEHLQFENFLELNDAEITGEYGIVGKDKRRLLSLIEFARNRVCEVARESTKMRYDLERQSINLKRSIELQRAAQQQLTYEAEKMTRQIDQLQHAVHPPLLLTEIPRAKILDAFAQKSHELNAVRRSLDSVQTKAVAQNERGNFDSKASNVNLQDNVRTANSPRILHSAPTLTPKDNRNWKSASSVMARKVEESNEVHDLVVVLDFAIEEDNLQKILSFFEKNCSRAESGINLSAGENLAEVLQQNQLEIEDSVAETCIFAIFCVLLRHITGLPEFVVGLVFSQRHAHAQLARGDEKGIQVGPLSSIFPLRADFTEMKKTVADILQEMFRTMKRAKACSADVSEATVYAALASQEFGVKVDNIEYEASKCRVIFEWIDLKTREMLMQFGQGSNLAQVVLAGPPSFSGSAIPIPEFTAGGGNKGCNDAVFHKLGAGALGGVLPELNFRCVRVPGQGVRGKWRVKREMLMKGADEGSASDLGDSCGNCTDSAAQQLLEKWRQKLALLVDTLASARPKVTPATLISRFYHTAWRVRSGGRKDGDGDSEIDLLDDSCGMQQGLRTRVPASLDSLEAEKLHCRDEFSLT